ncbi:hypothetical protein ACWCP8_11275 [Streptomyces sp. NPDC002206]
MTVHPFIEVEKWSGHNVKRACELLKVSRNPLLRPPRIPTNSRPLLSHSTTGPARLSVGRHPPKPSTNIYSWSKKPVLRRPLEPGQYTSQQFAALAKEFGVLLSAGRPALTSSSRWG